MEMVAMPAEGPAGDTWAEGQQPAMIHFTCEHCQQAVRVAESFAGMHGRCPHCDGLVTIPREEQAIHALAAALGSGSTETDADASETHIPPPPAVEDSLADEDLPLPARHTDSLDDTVILPAPQPSAPDDPQSRRRHAGTIETAPALRTRWTLLIVAAAIVVVAVAVLGFLVIFLAR